MMSGARTPSVDLHVQQDVALLRCDRGRRLAKPQRRVILELISQRGDALPIRAAVVCAHFSSTVSSLSRDAAKLQPRTASVRVGHDVELTPVVAHKQAFDEVSRRVVSVVSRHVPAMPPRMPSRGKSAPRCPDTHTHRRDM